MKRVSRLPWIRILIAAAITWVAIARHGPRERGAELRAELLNRRVEHFSFKDETLSGVIGRVSKASGIRIDVDWGALAAVDVTPDRRISGLTYIGSVSDALEGVVERVDPTFQKVRYRFEGERIVITTVAECAGPIQCRAYDVQDLLEDLERERDAKGALTAQWRFRWQPVRAGLAALPGLPGSGMRYGPRNTNAKLALESLVLDRAAAAYSRLCAGADPPRRIAWVHGGQLVVVGTPTAQQEVRALLEYLRRHPESESKFQ